MPARSARAQHARRPRRPRDVPGLPARRAALAGLLAVDAGRALEDALDPGQSDGFAALEPRDRALARSLARTALRRSGQIDAALARCLSKGLPKGDTGRRVGAILRLGAAQLLFTDGADHAAVDLSVRLALEDEKARHFRPLING
ncbi:MAG: transcription antitermination factor NusB, partial [Pseudomonadota bacterium]